MKMPTVRWVLQDRYYYSSFEIFAMTKLKKRCLHFNAIQMFLISCKTRRCKLIFTEYDSENWDVDMLRAHFQFKRPELRSLMSAIHLTNKLLLNTRKEGHNIFHPIFAWWYFYDLWHIPVDLLICFWSLDILIFGLLSNRICNIFHDFFYLNFKQTLRLGCRNSEKQYEAANFLMNVSTTAAISLLRRCNLAWRVHQNGWLTVPVPVQAAQQRLPRQRCSACALGSINCITPLICWIILVLDFFKILVFPYATHIGRKDTTAVFLDYSLF